MSGMTKAQRLEDMRRLYIQHAYSDIELAERLGVDRTLVYRDRIELTGQYPIEKDDEGRYRIPRTKLISEIKVNLHEALTLYLAARKTSRQTRFHHPHAANALEKLAATLRQPMTEKLLKAADAVLKQEKDPERIKIIEILAQAWVEQRKVRIEYQPLGMDGLTRHTVSVFLIEPSIWSDSVYAIALSDFNDKIVPFKIERIKTAVLSGETFEIPADFDEQVLLKHAWGIWYGDKEPVTVKLRFNKEAARRVKESIWHPLETVTDTEDGGCIWSADVAEWREMLPWIRGWGADVEVLEPEGLRNDLKREVVRMAKQYGLDNSAQKPGYLYLWAKAEKKTRKIHRLLYHLIDVGQCALALWESNLPELVKQSISQSLGLTNSDDAGRLVAFWSALHDLGKASPEFQDHPRLYEPLKGDILSALRDSGFAFPTNRPGEFMHHAVITTWALREEKDLLPQFDYALVQKFAQAIGGHHGAWPISGTLNHMDSAHTGANLAGWHEARQALVGELVTVFQPPVVEKLSLNVTTENTLLTLVSGIVSVADWLGSDEKIFDYEDQFKSTAIYAESARQNAHKALSDYQLQPLPTLRQPFDFLAAFDKTPRGAQTQTLSASLQPPALVILEAPMGSGKTEAAFGLYAQWAQTADLRGMYIAMPTMATSNQMHERVEKFLKWLYGAQIVPMLIHSRAQLKDVRIDEGDRVDEDRASALAWFLPRKKSLLFPFGVGTVDQTLMSVLQTKHFFVRLLGLSHKVIIFDEVHAYDAYMNTLFQRLLGWLRELGASVILLSATLPAATRRDLLSAYGGNPDNLPETEYPRLSYTANGQTDAMELNSPPERKILLTWMERDPATIVKRLREELKAGGCAAVICNTVKRAQKIYRALCQEPDFNTLGDDLILFHARTPFAWREKKEKAVLGKFGPPSEDGRDKPERPHKAIVVATQVIEQSLDLDFDVMISDFAPADLLLQRAGRLQRHQREVRHHPDRLMIAAPVEEDSVPQIDYADKKVYAPYVLLRSWLALKRVGQVISLPAQVEALIEQVYGDDEFAEATDAMQLEIKKARRKMDEKTVEAENMADERLVREPSSPKLMRDENMELEEDNPELHAAFQALTRLGEPGITLVCLHEVANGLALEPNGAPINYKKPDAKAVIQLSLYTMNVQDKRVVKHFLGSTQQNTPATWQKISALRYARLAIFKKKGECPLDETLTLFLTPDLGLQIDNPKEA